MNKLVMFFILSNSILLHSQTFSPDGFMMMLSPGDIAYQQNDYKRAIIEFNKTIKDGKANAATEYNLGVVYAIAGKIDSAFYFITRAQNAYNDNLTIVLGDPDLLSLTKDKRWNKFEHDAAEKYFKNHAVDNKSLSLKLFRMLMDDQAYYYIIKSIKNEKNTNNDPEIKKLWTIKDSLNKTNIKELEKVINEFGYPTIKMVGKKASEGAFMILQHADLSTQKKYLPIIEKLAFNAEISKINYAMLKDRILVTEGKKQLYGTQVQTVTNSLFPIEDSINVEQRRKEMGFTESLDDYLRHFTTQPKEGK